MLFEPTFKRIRTLSGHPISPWPIFVSFLGFWLPLKWMTEGTRLRFCSFLDALRAISASVVLGFLPVIVALFVLVIIILWILPLKSISFPKRAQKALIMAGNLVIILATLITIKHLILGPLPMGLGYEILALAISASIVLFLSLNNSDLMKILPGCDVLVAILLPISILVTSQECISIFLHKPSIMKQNFKVPTGCDVILFTIDDLSARHINVYELARPSTPAIEALARDGILFENFYSNANWTRPGIASILNGTRPWVHGGDLWEPGEKLVIPLNLMGRLVAAGFDVRTVSSNFFADHTWQGTADFIQESDTLSWDFPSFLKYSHNFLIGVQIGPIARFLCKVGMWSHSSWDRLSEPLHKSIFALRVAPRKNPRFFWLHLLPPHDPYAAPPPYLGVYEPSNAARTPAESGADYFFSAREHAARQPILSRRYDESVLAADAAIGKILQWLKDQGRYENALIILTSDHGESFSHGYGGHGGPLLTEDLIRVPLIIKPPGHHGPVRVKELYEQADLAPTILRMVGLPIPDGYEGKPYPLRPVDAPVFSMNRDVNTLASTLNLAMRTGNWKYVVHFGHWVYPWPQEELYDLGSDPDENHNLVGVHPEVAASCRQRVLEELASRGMKPEAP